MPFVTILARFAHAAVLGLCFIAWYSPCLAQSASSAAMLLIPARVIEAPRIVASEGVHLRADASRTAAHRRTEAEIGHIHISDTPTPLHVQVERYHTIADEAGGILPVDAYTIAKTCNHLSEGHSGDPHTLDVHVAGRIDWKRATSEVYTGAITVSIAYAL